MGEPDVKRAGSDITIVSIGATLYRALEAAEQLQEKYGMSAEVIDARSIVPFNYDLVIESLKKTGRVLLTSDANERGSYLKDMAQNLTEMAFDELVQTGAVGAFYDVVGRGHSAGYDMDLGLKANTGHADWILDAIHEKIVPLPGHTVKNNFTSAEKIRRSKLGI